MVVVVNRSSAEIDQTMNFRRARQAEVIKEKVRDRGNLSHSKRGWRLA